MAYNGTKTRTWDQTTPADGDLFEAEFNRAYGNTDDLNTREIQHREFQKGSVKGRMWVDPSSAWLLKAPKNNVYEVDGNLIRLSGALQLDFTALTNIYRNDGTTAIAATSETQNKHLYVLMTTTGSLHAMIVPDSEMEGSSHVYDNNTKLLEDYYNVSPSIWDSSKNGYYKNGKRIIGVLRLDGSNHIEFQYELGHGHRYMDHENISVGSPFEEIRWKREHPGCYIPDGSTITNMATESPYLYRLLGGSNVLPDWRDRFPRQIDIAGGRTIRDTQEDAFQGFNMEISRLDNSSTHILPATTAGASANGVYTGSSAPERFIASGYFTDGANGTPRVDNETRSKNYSVLKQIVRG
ncbi:MAG: hypothetical protein KDK36_02910 [Leptospiraceae bacterium]|nr:hypothetical protein [Leptospiraceae bacterium]